MGAAEMWYICEDKVITRHRSGNDENSVEHKSVDGTIVFLRTHAPCTEVFRCILNGRGV